MGCEPTDKAGSLEMMEIALVKVVEKADLGGPGKECRV